MHLHSLSPIALLRFGFAIAVGCLLLLATAQADTIPEFTGSFNVGQAYTIHGSGGGTVEFQLTSPGSLFFSGIVGNYREDPPCFVGPCDQQYGGDITGGGISFDTWLQVSPTDLEDLGFGGTITGGGFSGDNHLGVTALDTFLSERAGFGFTGRWSNGWFGTGSLDVSWTYTPDIIVNQSGTLNLVTFTPEAPEPSTLALLGSGILGLTATLRRRYRK